MGFGVPQTDLCSDSSLLASQCFLDKPYSPCEVSDGKNRGGFCESWVFMKMTMSRERRNRFSNATLMSRGRMDPVGTGALSWAKTGRKVEHLSGEN